MNAYLLVFLGGGIGSALRLFVQRLATLWLPQHFPWGTLIVNLGGGLTAGLIAGGLSTRAASGSDAAMLFLVTGLLGGFTTFSAFSLDAVALWQRGAQLAAAFYVGSSVMLAIAGAVLGLALVRAAS